MTSGFRLAGQVLPAFDSCPASRPASRKPLAGPVLPAFGASSQSSISRARPPSLVPAFRFSCPSTIPVPIPLVHFSCPCLFLVPSTADHDRPARGRQARRTPVGHNRARLPPPLRRHTGRPAEGPRPRPRLRAPILEPLIPSVVIDLYSLLGPHIHSRGADSRAPHPHHALRVSSTPPAGRPAESPRPCRCLEGPSKRGGGGGLLPCPE